MMDDFTKYPVTIGELKKDSSAHSWSPRDCLVSVLRAIDSGESKPEVLVVAMLLADDEPGSTTIDYRASSPNPAMTFGCLDMVARKISVDGAQ